MATKQEIKDAKDALRTKLREIRAAEALLRDLYTQAAPEIGTLIKVTGKPGPHKIRLDDGTVLMFSFRKTDETVHDGKKIPVYGMKETDLSDDED